MERKQFTFYRSYLDAIRRLPKKEQGNIVLAICNYALDETIPSALSPIADTVFTLVKPTLDASRRKAEVGSCGGKTSSKAQANDKQSVSKTEANRKQTVSEKEKEKEREKEGEIEIEKENECSIYSSSDLRGAPGIPGASPPTISLPLNDGSAFEIFQSDIDMWSNLYPAVDVMQQLRNMAGWIDGNPSKRKTRSGIKRFVNSWLAKEQNKGGDRATNAKSGFAYNAEFEEGTSL